MIRNQLQRAIGPFWVPYGEGDEAGHDFEDAESQALQYLAEIYAGTSPADWPGPYRIEVNGTNLEGEIVFARVTIDHARFEALYEEEKSREACLAEQSNNEMREST